jgi:hypothetical protein
MSDESMHKGKLKADHLLSIFYSVIDMFTMKELEPFIQMAVTMEINGTTFTLTKVDLSG